ncbi:hypothetical protein RHMOL_Rhmol02G0019300 [Rhododendron molle]|uniref:Uncharacterized protein n=1 Tax=Rhododendron molle TaxID=49168 RepID=A0ACC0PMZ2_RHOML|nr:hypothetical protein RHMOL_Rhmol02G0019300 [Rhododendron molle]
MSRVGRPENSESNVEVLVRKEYAVAKSWTILLVVSDLDGLNFNFHELSPLSYTKNGEVLTRVSTWKYVKYDRHVMAFNPIDNSHRKISIPDDPRFYIIAYEESVITPTDYGWEEEDLKGEATYVVHSYAGDSWNMKKGSDGHYWPTTCINSAIEAESGEKQRNNDMDGLPNSKYCESDLEQRVQISSSCFTSSHTQGSVSDSTLAFHLMLLLICLMVGAWLWC